MSQKQPLNCDVLCRSFCLFLQITGPLLWTPRAATRTGRALPKSARVVAYRPLTRGFFPAESMSWRAPSCSGPSEALLYGRFSTVLEISLCSPYLPAPSAGKSSTSSRWIPRLPSSRAIRGPRWSWPSGRARSRVRLPVLVISVRRA